MTPSEHSTDLAGPIEEAIAGLADPRCRRIIVERTFADNKIALERFGEEFHLTRERIRQLEAGAVSYIREMIDSDKGVAAADKLLHDFSGVAYPLSAMIARLPSLGDVVSSVGQPVWRVLERLGTGMEIADGWCVKPSKEEAIRFTKQTLGAAADQRGIVPLSAVTVVSARCDDVMPEIQEQWLQYCGIPVGGEFAFLKTSSVKDYAAAVLSVAGRPLTLQEILDQFIYKRSIHSLRNKISADDRFDRVDRGKWALREWGMESYLSIRKQIDRQLSQHGGSVKLSELIEQLTKAFSISEISVRAYASSPPFQCKKGIISRAPAKKAFRPPETATKLFRIPGGWAYRIHVNREHRRGSGTLAPLAVAAILGLEFGESRKLDSPLGPQAVYWTGIQPSFGSVRRFIVEYGIEMETDAFLVLYDNGTFDFKPAQPPSGDPLADALRLVDGPATNDPDQARQALARALSLPETTKMVELIEAYKVHGEDDIAKLLWRAKFDSEDETHHRC